MSGHGKSMQFRQNSTFPKKYKLRPKDILRCLLFNHNPILAILFWSIFQLISLIWIKKSIINSGVARGWLDPSGNCVAFKASQNGKCHEEMSGMILALQPLHFRFSRVCHAPSCWRQGIETDAHSMAALIRERISEVDFSHILSSSINGRWVGQKPSGIRRDWNSGFAPRRIPKWNDYSKLILLHLS